MATLIDSSVSIAMERGALALDAFSARFAEEDVAVSAVTASELLHGVHRARTPASGMAVKPSLRGCSRSFP